MMIPGSKVLTPHELAHRWLKDLGTRPDMRILGRIAGVQCTEQSAGIIVGVKTPDDIREIIYLCVNLFIYR